MTAASTPTFRAGQPTWINGFWKMRVFQNGKMIAIYWRTVSFSQTIKIVNSELEKIAKRHNGKTISWKQSGNYMGPLAASHNWANKTIAKKIGHDKRNYYARKIKGSDP